VEEVELLQEKMKQVKQFFLTHAKQWEAQVTAVGTLCVSNLSIAKGLYAFASEQAAQYHAIHAHCKHLWQYVAEYIALGVGDVVPSEAQTVDGNMAVIASE